MKVRVQVVLEPDDECAGNGNTTVVVEIAQLERSTLQIDTLGLQLAEAKDLLQKVQEIVIEEQIHRALAKQVACGQCGRPHRHKDRDTIVVRTFFGTLRLRSPRGYRCRCQPHSRGARSAHWLQHYRNGPRRNCCTSRASSRGWSRTA